MRTPSERSQVVMDCNKRLREAEATQSPEYVAAMAACNGGWENDTERVREGVRDLAQTPSRAKSLRSIASVQESEDSV